MLTLQLSEKEVILILLSPTTTESKMESNQQEHRLVSGSDSEPPIFVKKQRLEEPAAAYAEGDGDVEMTSTAAATSSTNPNQSIFSANDPEIEMQSTQSIDPTPPKNVQSHLPNIRVIKPPSTDGPSE